MNKKYILLPALAAVAVIIFPILSLFDEATFLVFRTPYSKTSNYSQPISPGDQMTQIVNIPDKSVCEVSMSINPLETTKGDKYTFRLNDQTLMIDNISKKQREISLRYDPPVQINGSATIEIKAPQTNSGNIRFLLNPETSSSSLDPLLFNEQKVADGSFPTLLLEMYECKDEPIINTIATDSGDFATPYIHLGLTIMIIFYILFVLQLLMQDQ